MREQTHNKASITQHTTSLTSKVSSNDQLIQTLKQTNRIKSAKPCKVCAYHLPRKINNSVGISQQTVCHREGVLHGGRVIGECVL